MLDMAARHRVTVHLRNMRLGYGKNTVKIQDHSHGATLGQNTGDPHYVHLQ